MLKEVIGHIDIKNKFNFIKDDLPKVLLFIGPKNVGKTFTAFHLIDEIHGGTLTPRLFKHPDIVLLEPDTKVFKLDLIKELKKKLELTPFELDTKYFILKNIDKMNKESSNACLKIFEDIPRNTQFILTAENEELVLPTILTRSVIINFSLIYDLDKYYPDMSKVKIDLSGGCPGNLNLLKDLDEKLLFNKLNYFLNNLKNMSYSEILLWFLELKVTDYSLLLNAFIICIQEKFKENKYTEVDLLTLSEIKKFKEKLYFNLNIDIHFKNMLYQIKYLLETANRIVSCVFEESSEDLIDTINQNDNPEVMTYSYESNVIPYLSKFIKVTFDSKDLAFLDKFVKKVIKEKIKESHYQIDNDSMYKRFYTGFLGEMAVSKMLHKDLVNWNIDKSEIFNVADLKGLNLDIGVKTVEFGKYPVVSKNPERAEIIALKENDSIYLCGVATKNTLLNKSTDSLILSSNLRKRNVKTAFYGFNDLIFFNSDNLIETLQSI